MLLSAQSRKGNPYGRIKRIYQIFFLNCILFPHSNKLPRRYSYREEKEHNQLTEATEIIFYELPKLERRIHGLTKDKINPKTLPEDEKWCIFMRYRHEEWAAALIEKLCREEEGIMHAEKTLTKVSRDYKKYARNMAILKNSMDRASEIYNARHEGIVEGKAEGETAGRAAGKAEANLEIARKMKKKGRPFSEIIEFTGLPTETIEKL